MGRKKVHYYWTDEVDYGIKKYLNTTDLKKRNNIYRLYLDMPFRKMCEIIINRWSWNYIPNSFEDIQTEMVTHMFNKMNLFNPNKGRSFSYFSLILKNYLIRKNTIGYKETLKRKSMSELNKFGYIDGYGSTKDKSYWQNVSSTLDMKDNFHTFIGFLNKHGNEIIEPPYNEVIKPLVEFVDDIDNTKYYNQRMYIKHILRNTSLDSTSLHRTTQRIKHLYRRFTQKIHSQKDMDVWLSLLSWKYIRN